MKDDLISRQAAIDVVLGVVPYDEYWKEQIEKAVNALPSAQPVRHGTWIVEYEVKDGRSMRCSECQMVFWVGSGRNANYCPNCGAKMDEEKV